MAVVSGRRPDGKERRSVSVLAATGCWCRWAPGKPSRCRRSRPASVVGAIGPLTIMRDRRGERMLLPQYFGVLPEHRGQGHGRALWCAAADWGRRRRAAYQLLQTRAGYASDRLFLSEGLRSLGFAASVTA